jgi:hypothetical protein
MSKKCFCEFQELWAHQMVDGCSVVATEIEKVLANYYLGRRLKDGPGIQAPLSKQRKHN